MNTERFQRLVTSVDELTELIPIDAEIVAWTACATSSKPAMSAFCS